MRQESSQGESVALAPGPVAGAGAGPADTTVALPRLGGLRARVVRPRPAIAVRPLSGRLALATLMLSALVVTVFATAVPSVLVPRSGASFPHWMSGPLHHVFGRLPNDPLAVSIGFTVVLAVMAIAYGVALAAVRTMSMRMIVAVVVALNAILVLSPPLQLTDLFNYLGYARLGGLHHLNPYTHVIANAIHDPVYRFTSWHHLHSPYGPAFTAATYPLAWLPLPVAYWIIKVATVAAGLGFVALVWRIAHQLGRDPRFAVLFVAANPVTLMYAVAGFHNDFFMLIPAMAAISLVLARRDRWAGAVLMCAVAVKFTAILLLPFLLLATRRGRRFAQVLIGAAIAAPLLAAASVALFGFSIPNLSDQSTLLTDFSVPNLVGLLLGLGGGTPGLLRAANVALVLAIALILRRRRGDWLTGAGWATLALIASLAWLVPWYLTWLLPLAALGSSVRLRRATVALTIFVLLSFVPVTGIVLTQLNVSPMSGAAAQASKDRQHQLER
jgi:hypothetical protein